MYATVADVERYNALRAPFSAQTKPTASAVGGLIDDATAQIHAELTRQGYAIPVLPAASFSYALVKVAVAQVAAFLVEEVAPTSSTERRNHYSRMSEAAKRALRASELPDLARKSSHRVRYPTNIASPMFSRDMEL